MHIIVQHVVPIRFGDNVENAMEHVRFAIFYVLCGLFADVVNRRTTRLGHPSS